MEVVVTFNTAVFEGYVAVHCSYKDGDEEVHSIITAMPYSCTDRSKIRIVAISDGKDIFVRGYDKTVLELSRYVDSILTIYLSHCRFEILEDGSQRIRFGHKLDATETYTLPMSFKFSVDGDLTDPLSANCTLITVIPHVTGSLTKPASEYVEY